MATRAPEQERADGDEIDRRTITLLQVVKRRNLRLRLKSVLDEIRKEREPTRPE